MQHQSLWDKQLNMLGAEMSFAFQSKASAERDAFSSCPFHTFLLEMDGRDCRCHIY